MAPSWRRWTAPVDGGPRPRIESSAGTPDDSDVAVADPGAETEVGAKLRTRALRQRFRNRTCRIVQIAEYERAIAGSGAGFDARGIVRASCVDAMHAEIAGFDRTLATRRPGSRVLHLLVHKGRAPETDTPITQYLQPMQVCLSTSTMPSARLNDAPVGQTSTHGGSVQCWHMSGRVLIRPVARSRSVTLWIHLGSVAGPCIGSSPCSSSQARTQASQSRAHVAESTSIPYRTSLPTGS